MLLFAALPAAALGAGAAPAQDAGDFSVKFGYDRTDGKYGQPRSTTLDTWSVTLTYDADDWSFDFMLPYLRETGPGRIIFLPGRRPFIIIGPPRVASGPGDATAGATRYLLDQERNGFDLDVGAIVKLGGASRDKGLGTGKPDLSVQAAAARSLGALSITGTAGYTFVGKAGGLDLKNSTYESLDASFKIASPLSIGLTYSWGQTSAKGTPGSRDLTAYIDWKLGKRWRLELYGVKGYTIESPDRGGGVTLTCDL